jgi:glutathione S-transferase
VATSEFVKVFGCRPPRTFCEGFRTPAVTNVSTRTAAGVRRRKAWLVGDDAASIADIACFPYVLLAPEGGFDLATYPAVSAWTRRVKGLARYVPAPGESGRAKTDPMAAS